MTRAVMLALVGPMMITSAASAADLVFEGGGERMAVPGERLELEAFARDSNGDPAVQFRLGENDAEAFYQLTIKAIGRELAVIVCGEVLLRPIVREPIASGNGIIVVNSAYEAMTLIARLKGDEACPNGGGS